MTRKIKRKKVELFFIVMAIFVLILILLGGSNVYKSCETIYKQSNDNLILEVDRIKQSSNNHFFKMEKMVDTSKFVIEKTINYVKINKIRKRAFLYNKNKIPYISNYLNNVVQPMLFNFADPADGIEGIYFDFDGDFLPHKNVIGVWYTRLDHDNDFEITDNGFTYQMFPITSPSLEWYYKPKKLKRGAWSKPYIDDDLKITMITYSAPVYSNKKFIGVVGIDISMKCLENFINKFKLYKSGNAYLIGQDGKIIYAKNYKTLSSAATIDKNLYDCLNKACTNYLKSISGEIKLISSSSSSDKLFAVTTLYNGIFLVAEVSKSELYGEINKLISFTLYSIILAIIISLYISTKAYLYVKKINAQLMHKEKLISMGTMAAKTAHEINNPLGYIKCNIDTLKSFIKKIKTIIKSYDKSFTKILNKESTIEKEYENIVQIKATNKISYVLEDLDEIIEESQEGVERVSEIVVNLKNFAKDDSIDSKSNEDLVNIVEESLIILGNKLKKDVVVIKNFSEIPQIVCNKNKLKQVFVNIIDNAYYAVLATNSDDKRISISLYKKGKNAIIEIEDNGVGIEKNKINKIFNAFYTTKTQGKGTGLGLSIAYEIISNDHGGEIFVESKKGQGSKFIIALPYS